MLDQRKREVLRAVVHDYVLTAEPVGSRAIVRRHRLGVSPATVRNEMSDLEEMGYLEQPHTSAGRIPSAKGYRFYVDELMDAAHPTRQQIQSIRRLYANHLREIDVLLYQTARVLAETTDCLALVEGPQLNGAILQMLQLVWLRPGRALMVVVTDEGLVTHRMLDVPEEISRQDLERIGLVLTRRMRGTPIGRVGRYVLQELQSELSGYRVVLDVALDVLSDGGADDEEPKYVLGGAGNIFKQPEFRDVERAYAILNAVNEQQLIRDLLGASGSSGVRIVIGPENPVPAMQDCSLVTATYVLDNREIGRIAVIGPTRMDYPRVVPFVDLVTQCLSEVLTRRLG